MTHRSGIRMGLQLLCNWVISSMFSLNKSSLFLTPLRVYLSANPLFCRFRVFSLFDLREGVWLADVYECPPVSQTEIVKLLRLSKMERNSASKRSIRRFVVMEKAPTRAFSWLKAATTAFTFETLLRHYADRRWHHGLSKWNWVRNAKVIKDGWFG